MLLLADKSRNNVLDKYNRSYIDIALITGTDILIACAYSLISAQTRDIVGIPWLLMVFILFGSWFYTSLIKWILTPFFKGFDSFSDLEFPPFAHYLALDEKLGIIQSKSVFSHVFRLFFASLYSLPALYGMIWCIGELDQFWTIFFTYRGFVAVCTFAYYLILITVDCLDLPTGVELNFTPSFKLTCSKPKPKELPVADIIIDVTAVAEPVDDVPVDTELQSIVI